MLNPTNFPYSILLYRAQKSDALGSKAPPNVILAAPGSTAGMLPGTTWTVVGIVWASGESRGLKVSLNRGVIEH